MIVTCEQIQAAEERLFAGGVDAEPLMEKAGLGCALAIHQFFPQPHDAVLFIGTGNNGGDALVVGRHLRKWGWRVAGKLAASPGRMSPLAEKKLREFRGAEERGAEAPWPTRGRLILIDGLLGIGARGPLRGKIGELAAEMNTLRNDGHGFSFAIDIPSGVDGNTGEPYPGAVTADFTLTITRVKAGLVADAAIDHVGRLVQIPLPEIAMAPFEGNTDIEVSCPLTLRKAAGPRPFSMHKGQAGRVAIIAGSRGFTGAAQLCSRGALHGGAGLVTLFAKEDIYPILASTAPAEVMVAPTKNYREVADFPFDVLAIGPGIGREPEEADFFLDLMRNEKRPVVIDADGLTLLSRRLIPVDSFVPAGPRLLTPHPGELTRLWGGPLPEIERAGIARRFVDRCPSVTLLFKGARTVIASRERALTLNPTGTPGMASGGMGDVLTGLCAALIATPFRDDLHQAAATGSWLLGRAAEMARFSGIESPESLSAGHVAGFLGPAFDSLWRGDF